jgi:hypothetical protein
MPYVTTSDQAQLLYKDWGKGLLEFLGEYRLKAIGLKVALHREGHQKLLPHQAQAVLLCGAGVG